MADTYEDMRKWVWKGGERHTCVFDDEGCCFWPYDGCRICLLDAMKQKLRKMGLYWTCQHHESYDTGWTFIFTIDGFEKLNCKAKTELAALAGAVRQMMKEEKR